jgi:hypothetical protein
MKRILLTAAVALALSAPAVPHAHANSAWHVSGYTLNMSSANTARLVDSCRGVNPLNISCAGYITGVFDTLILTGKLCPPDNSGLTGQVVAIALKYLNDHPELWAASPAELIGDSLAPVFPCVRAAAQ